MSAKGRKQFLEAVAENQSIIRYVKLFRMPLFLTVLDEEFKKTDDSVWQQERTVRETAFDIMPITLQQFSIPREEIETIIEQCITEFGNK